MESNKEIMAGKEKSYTEIDRVNGLRKRHGFIKMNKSFVADFYLNNTDILEANIYAHRILGNIFMTLRNKQFWDGNENYNIQLNMFEDEYMTIDNSTIVFNMNSYEVCKGANYDGLQKALTFLENFQKDWYRSTNYKGQTIKTYGGLISNPVINNDTGGFQFHITSYWLKKIVNLTQYNQTFYNMIQNISSSKQIVFWYWLGTLPENGTTVNYQTLNERLDLNYKSARDFGKGFLKGARKSFDKYCHESFNYKISKDKIIIVKYVCKDDIYLTDKIKKQAKEGEIDIKKLRSTYTLSYICKRHQLSSEDRQRVKFALGWDVTTFIRAYHLFKIRCKESEIAMTKFKGKEFFEEIQLCINQAYRETTTGKHLPNNYPRI